MSFSLLRNKCFDISKHCIRVDSLRISSQEVQPMRYLSSTTQQKVTDINTQNTENLKKIANEQWKNMSRQEKMKTLVKDYGKTIIIFHITISLISLGLFYILVSSGIDMTSMLKYMTGDSEKFNQIMINSSTFVIAYGIHKLFAPVRIYITLGLAPIMVKCFRKIGLIKNPIFSIQQTKNK